MRFKYSRVKTRKASLMATVAMHVMERVALRSYSHIQISHIECMLLDEFATRFDLVTHEDRCLK